MTPATVFSRLAVFSFVGVFAFSVLLSVSPAWRRNRHGHSRPSRRNAVPAADLGAATELSFATGNNLLLRGRDAQRQLAVTANFAGGETRDVTRQARPIDAGRHRQRR